ncbi:putative polysaccharide biosynthesis protein [Pseudobutyrivibrio xylanivorans]|uniref:Stage V sporulation protein B n=1 Tax=Pseudobutyrivibrio xylanivorans DSM 14809 TaxID=1123012 RepID=A0A1M6I8D3_PSEXY|nr:polysaccharide biosynthesis protein [Pseudobutyrivibrio xylanivorans]SHJ30618.1 stage V sporulation protein B [Pseudobutyrivibrio xylanivorans DSM 14809]
MTTRNKRSDTKFLMQGSILAMASIISRIVGLIYRVPLTATIGKTGNDYYGTAYEIYNIILLISSYSIPLAVSKLVSARMAKGHVKDANKVLHGALLFAFITGGSASLIVFFGAEFFTGSLLKTPLSAIALKVLAPTLLVVAILGVFRGFFQGLGTMIPSAISQIGEQIVNAIVSVVAANILFSYGKKVGGVLGNVKGYAAAYGAAGGTLGTSTGAAFALIFVMFIYFAFKKVFKKMMQKDKHRNSEGYNEIMSALILTIIPVLLSTTVYNISSIIDQGIFKNFALYQGHDANAISESWGVFTGQYKVLINVPLAIASAMAASTVPSLTAAFHSNDDALVKKQINMANRFVMVIAFPCCVGMMVLASPIMQLLFNDTEKSSGLMLMIGGCSIIFYSLSTLSNGILQGLDKMTIPVKNALIALVAHVAFLFLLMEVFDLHIYAVIIANAFYALLMCFLNQSAVLKYSGARIDIKKVFLAPLEASALMGVIVYLVYRLLYGLVSLNASSNVANFVACVVSIIAGVIVYFVSMLLFKGVDEETLMKFPGGTKLCSIAYSLHLLR